MKWAVLLLFSLIAPHFSLLSFCGNWCAEEPVVLEPASAPQKIQHIVVLMLENRSFDNLLGTLYPKSEQFDGLSGEESNSYVDQAISSEVQVWNGLDSGLPSPDPGESFLDINEQLFGTRKPAADAVPTMAGFAQNYFEVSKKAPPNGVMHYFSPEQVPVLSQLAKNYAVCDAWFASAPCQTWPNRFFLHTGTAGGYENNTPYHFPYLMPTLFTRFNKLGLENRWKIYYNDFPQSAVLSDLWLHTEQFCQYALFKEDAANGTLPSYSFIEPRYYTEVDFPCDQHPPHDVRFAEEFIADVYNTLQASPNWPKTLLIILYDEHGGCYDHVAPPSAIPPEPPKPGQVFSFDRYGVRVPAVVISPYIQPGTVFRAPAGSQPFDHTSIISTVRKCFDLGGPLTERDRNAPDLFSLLTLSDDQLNLGAPIVISSVDRSADSLQMARDAELSGLQKSLYAIAAHLPNLLGFQGESLLEEVLHGVADLGEDIEALEQSTVTEALPYIHEKLSAFLVPLEK